MAAPKVTRLEVVTDQAENGPDANNSWGAHKLRIIRTKAGKIYTSYLVDDFSSDPVKKHWVLAERLNNGHWDPRKFEGVAGRENVNLLLGPDDSLYVVSWPKMTPTLLRKGPDDANFTSTVIPGVFEPSHWPYSSAGIDGTGRLTVIQSLGNGRLKPGKFAIAFQDRNKNWAFQVHDTDFRYCYFFVFPNNDGATLVAERDVKWETLGWAQPPGALSYVFDGVRQFGLSFTDKDLLSSNLIKEEAPNDGFRDVGVYLTDTYRDIFGDMHVLYNIRAPSTHGKTNSRHVLLKDGAVVSDSLLPGTGEHYRVIQNSKGTFFFFDSSGRVYISHEKVGTNPQGPFQLDFKGMKILANGLFFAVPRGGNMLTDDADFVFASANGNLWVYGRVNLPD